MLFQMLCKGVFLGWLCLLTGCISQDLYCSYFPILSLSSSPAAINTVNDRQTIITTPITVTNPGDPFIGQTPVLLTSAIEPATGLIYVILHYSILSAYYLGILDPSSSSISIIGEPGSNNIVIDTFTGMTFDCSGNLLAIERESVTLFSINITTAETTQQPITTTQSLKCGEFIDCTETIAYDWDANKLYRVSSDGPDTAILVVDGAAYNISDPFDLCDGPITALAYIGEQDLLLSCEGSSEGIYLLEASDLNDLVIADFGLGAGVVPSAVGLVPSGADGVCAASCVDVVVSVVETGEPTLEPTWMPSGNPTTNPSTANPSASPVTVPTVSRYAASDESYDDDYVYGVGDESDEEVEEKESVDDNVESIYEESQEGEEITGSVVGGYVKQYDEKNGLSDNQADTSTRELGRVDSTGDTLVVMAWVLAAFAVLVAVVIAAFHCYWKRIMEETKKQVPFSIQISTLEHSDA